MNIKRLIPNLFTMLNLFCGCVALVCVANSEFGLAFFFVALGIFFDFFDGFFARKLGVAGPLGVQLDSLADMVTSGVVPGYVVYQMLFVSGKYVTYPSCQNYFDFLELIPALGFIIALGACYRLAKFNIDTRQSDSFIGLPTPANSLFFTSLPLVAAAYPNTFFAEYLSNQWVLIAMALLSAYVMNAEIPLFSLKIKNFSVAKYKLQLFFVVLCIALLAFFSICAVPLIIILYVLLSVFDNLFKITSKSLE